MSDGTTSIGSVGAAPGVDAVLLTLSGAPASQRGAARRERRLKWLAAVREALGEGAACLADGSIEGDRATVTQARARIADAMGAVEAARMLVEGEDGDVGVPDTSRCGQTITAALLAEHICTGADRARRTQSRISAETVRRLIGR